MISWRGGMLNFHDGLWGVDKRRTEKWPWYLVTSTRPVWMEQYGQKSGWRLKRTRGSGARGLKSLQAFREGMQRNRFVRHLGWGSSVFLKLTGSYSSITCWWVWSSRGRVLMLHQGNNYRIGCKASVEWPFMYMVMRKSRKGEYSCSECGN